MKISFTPQPDHNWHIGQIVHIISGPFVDFIGEIYEIRAEEKKLRVKIDFMGRKTPVELNFLQIEEIDESD